MLKEFDEKVQGLVNQERMNDYGHPLDHFARTAKIKKVLQACPDPELRHALEMIADKMVRLCHSPEHSDSWIDIAGYARTGVMIIDEREERNLTKALVGAPILHDSTGKSA